MKECNYSGNWIFLCNPKYYLIDKAFSENEEIYWHQIRKVNNISVGSIVYIYVSGKERLIKYKCEVIEKDVVTPKKDDSIYSLRQDKLDEVNKQEKYLLLKLLSKVDNKKLNLEFLKENGVTCFMGPISLTTELNEKINEEI